MSASVERPQDVASGRLWFYTNYHCNLACTYCLTASRPDAPRRLLDRDVMEAIASDAAAHGFASFGVTGGEPFSRPDMPDVLASLARLLPTVVLTNGTLFSSRVLARLRELAALPLALQVSLDSADVSINDATRGAGDLARATAGIRSLLAIGMRVRIGSTVDGSDPSGLERLCDWHRALGIDDADHIVRPIVRRGRADEGAFGLRTTIDDVPAELTITAEGAYWSPVGPTVTDGALDVDYLLTRTIRPLAIPVRAMRRYAGGREARDPTALVT